MKKLAIKYRGIVIISASLVFNLVSSLLVWHPKGYLFNISPLSITEWTCDIVSIIGFFVGIIIMFFDIHENEKQKIKEAILEANEELKKDEDAIVHFRTSESK